MSADRGSEPRLVVFDFDGTLYRGDSGVELVLWLLRRQPLRAFAALLAAPLLAPLFQRMRWRRVVVSGFLWIASVGVSDREGEQRLARYVRDNAAALRARLLDAGLACLHRHRQAGDRVVIATGAPPELVAQILALTAHEPVPVVGTVLGRRAGGLVAVRHCHGEEKLRMLREAGFEAPVAVAYSDSTADLPLLLSAQQPVVVNAGLKTQAAFARALGARMHTLRWVGARERA